MVLFRTGGTRTRRDFEFVAALKQILISDLQLFRVFVFAR